MNQESCTAAFHLWNLFFGIGLYLFVTLVNCSGSVLFLKVNKIFGQKVQYLVKL